MSAFDLNRFDIGDALKMLRKVPSGTFQCCVTSPPYWGLRNYDHPKQYGLEPTPKLFVNRLVKVFREVRRVLRDDGSLWLNLGDSYASGGCGGGGKFMAERGAGAWAERSRLKGFRKEPEGLKHKDLVGIPWRVAFALQADGWWLRSEIIWHKPNPMPESVADRPTKSHEQVFLLAKHRKDFYDAKAVAEPAVEPNWSRDAGPLAKNATEDPLLRTRPKGRVIQGGETRNARDVWTLSSEPYEGAHFATMPRELAKRCILAGCPEGGAVLDPFFGSGTVGEVAESIGRRWYGIDINPAYAPLIAQRTKQIGMQFGETERPAC